MSTKGPFLHWKNVLFRRDQEVSSYFRCALPYHPGHPAHYTAPFRLPVPCGTTMASLHLFFSIQEDLEPTQSATPLHLLYVELERDQVTGADVRLALDLGHYVARERPISSTVTSGVPGADGGASRHSATSHDDSSTGSETGWVHVDQEPAANRCERGYACEITWMLPASSSGAELVYKRCQVLAGDPGEVLLDVIYVIEFIHPWRPTESQLSDIPHSVDPTRLVTSETGARDSPQTPIRTDDPSPQQTPTRENVSCVSKPPQMMSPVVDPLSPLASLPKSGKHKGWLRKTKSVMLQGFRTKKSDGGATPTDTLDHSMVLQDSPVVVISAPNGTAHTSPPKSRDTVNTPSTVTPKYPKEIERHHFSWERYTIPSRSPVPMATPSRKPSKNMLGVSPLIRDPDATADEWEDVGEQLRMVPVVTKDGSPCPTGLYQMVVPPLPVVPASGPQGISAAVTKTDLFNRLGHWLYNTSPVQFFKRADQKRRVKDRYDEQQPIVHYGTVYNLHLGVSGSVPTLATKPVDQTSPCETPNGSLFPLNPWESQPPPRRRPRRLSTNVVQLCQTGKGVPSPSGSRRTSRDMGSAFFSSGIVTPSSSPGEGEPPVGRRRSSTWSWARPFLTTPNLSRNASHLPPLPNTPRPPSTVPQLHRQRQSTYSISVPLAGAGGPEDDRHSTVSSLPGSQRRRRNPGLAVFTSLLPNKASTSLRSAPLVEPTTFNKPGQPNPSSLSPSPPDPPLNIVINDDKMEPTTGTTLKSQPSGISMAIPRPLGHSQESTLHTHSYPLRTRQGWYYSVPSSAHSSIERFDRQRRWSTAAAQLLQEALPLFRIREFQTVGPRTPHTLTGRWRTLLARFAPEAAHSSGPSSYSSIEESNHVDLVLQLAIYPTRPSGGEEVRMGINKPSFLEASNSSPNCTVQMPPDTLKSALDGLAVFFDCRVVIWRDDRAATCPELTEQDMLQDLAYVENWLVTLRCDLEVLFLQYFDCRDVLPMDLSHLSSLEVYGQDTHSTVLLRKELFHQQFVNYGRRTHLMGRGLFGEEALVSAIQQAMAVPVATLGSPSPPRITTVFKQRRQKRASSTLYSFVPPETKRTTETPVRPSSISTRWDPVVQGVYVFNTASSAFGSHFGLKSLVTIQDTITQVTTRRQFTSPAQLHHCAVPAGLHRPSRSLGHIPAFQHGVTNSMGTPIGRSYSPEDGSGTIDTLPTGFERYTADASSRSGGVTLMGEHSNRGLSSPNISRTPSHVSNSSSVPSTEVSKGTVPVQTNTTFPVSSHTLSSHPKLTTLCITPATYTLRDFSEHFCSTFYFSYQVDFPPIPTHATDIQRFFAELQRPTLSPTVSNFGEQCGTGISRLPPHLVPHTPTMGHAQLRPLSSQPTTPSAISMTSPTWVSPITPTDSTFLSSYTSDSGWGCMHRSSQMLMARGYWHLLLGPAWRPRPDLVNGEEMGRYFEILSWFVSDYGPHMPYAIQRMSLEGIRAPFHVPIGGWFGPSVAAHVLKQLAHAEHKNNPVHVEVCTDQLVIPEVLLAQLPLPQSEIHRLAGDHIPTMADPPQQRRPVILLVPVRLGTDKLNRQYLSNLRYLFSLPQCLGIAGGQPGKSLYFTGYQGDEVFYLDPHVPRPFIPFTRDTTTFPAKAYHVEAVRACKFADMDPSMLLGFAFRDTLDFYNWWQVRLKTWPNPKLALVSVARLRSSSGKHGSSGRK
ncbi:hypothetical protein IWQ61_007176 [Dispira simplex]|nr:hypothetical protein IWQ61_007176 [Dispira simplex]